MITELDQLRYVDARIAPELFCRAKATVKNWAEKTNAVNADGSYDIVKMIQWREAGKEGKEDKNNLEMEKLRAEVRLKESQADRVEDNFVLRAAAEQQYTSFFRSVSQFFERSPVYWKQQFHMIHADVAERKLIEYGKGACNQLAEAPSIPKEETTVEVSSARKKKSVDDGINKHKIRRKKHENN